MQFFPLMVTTGQSGSCMAPEQKGQETSTTSIWWRCEGTAMNLRLWLLQHQCLCHLWHLWHQLGHHPHQPLVATPPAEPRATPEPPAAPAPTPPAVPAPAPPLPPSPRTTRRTAASAWNLWAPSLWSGRQASHPHTCSTLNVWASACKNARQRWEHLRQQQREQRGQMMLRAQASRSEQCRAEAAHDAEMAGLFGWELMAHFDSFGQTLRRQMTLLVIMCHMMLYKSHLCDWCLPVSWECVGCNLVIWHTSNSYYVANLLPLTVSWPKLQGCTYPN